MFCSKCGKEIAGVSSFCQHCGGSLSATPGNIQSPIITSGLTVEDFTAFVGTNSEKYLPKFAKFNAGGIDSFKATWHWPAFFVPFWWMLYRKLYGWAVLYFFIPLGPIWAIVANRLYYNHAKKKLLKIKQLHPAPETQKAVITATGGVSIVAVVAVIGGFVVLGILLAIAIPGYLGYQESARKRAVISSMASASPELQAWLYSSLKGKYESLRDTREIDTDGNGAVNNEDLTSSELLNKGVCTQFVMMKTSMMNEKSPWDANIDLWTTNTGNGQIQCLQSADTGITLTAFDKSGGVIETKSITAEFK